MRLILPVLLLWPVPIPADITAVAAADRAAWAAVGQITYGAKPRAGAAICTGSLVAPDLVLTAGHCVGQMSKFPATIQFAAGWDGRRHSIIRRGAQVILPAGAANLSTDIALVRLDSPISESDAKPLPLLAAPTSHSTPYTTIAYRRDAAGWPTRRDDCTWLQTADRVLGFDCAVVSGNSGAPVLTETPTGWGIVAVMVATQKASSVHAIAVIPPDDLRGSIAPE